MLKDRLTSFSSKYLPSVSLGPRWRKMSLSKTPLVKYLFANSNNNSNNNKNNNKNKSPRPLSHTHSEREDETSSESESDQGEAIAVNTPQEQVINTYDVIPRFYFPEKRNNCAFNRIPASDGLTQKKREMERVFRVYRDLSMPLNDFSARCTKGMCKFPEILNNCLAKRMATLYPALFPAPQSSSSSSPSSSAKSTQSTTEEITRIPHAAFARYWEEEMANYDSVERVFRLLKQPAKEFIEPADLLPLLRELVRTHPGLRMLRNNNNNNNNNAARDFQEKYILTAIARIFYTVNTSRTGLISLRELRHSTLIDALHFVSEHAEHPNINEELDFFNYQHFYVLFVTFLELDQDGDGVLSPQELSRYMNRALTPIAVERIFHTAECAFTNGERGFLREMTRTRDSDDDIDDDEDGEMRMSYADFVYFFLSDVDKMSRVALRYWFRCCDWDDDGVLSLTDLRMLYRCQWKESLPSEDSSSYAQDECFASLFSQYVDLINPEDSHAITFNDLTASWTVQMESGMLFNEIFHAEHSSLLQLRSMTRDNFKSKLNEFAENDWVRFAEGEYARMERAEIERRTRILV